MEKSLSSLHFFREAFPCEVILVDTGCNAEYRAVAERYADKIIDFPWRDDFGAARNAGVEAARGEWFMFLDDDEWFEDPQEIVSFFTTGEYRKYNSASYVARNYSDPNGKMYEDSYPSRMVKLEPETHFVGRIHEYLVPFKMPMKQFSDFVHHYGYAFKTDEDRMKHYARNKPILEEMCREYVGDPRWRCQLAQEYFSGKDYEKVVTCGIEGLAEWNEAKDRINYGLSHVGALYAYILIALETLERYGEAEEWLQKALKEPIFEYAFMEPTVAFFSLVGARVSNKQGKHEKAAFYLKKYMESADKLQGNRRIIEAGSAAIVNGVYQKQLQYGVILLCANSAILMEDYDLVEKVFYQLDWSDRRLLLQADFEKRVLAACCSVAYHPLWVKMLQTLVSRADGMREMRVVFLETEIAFKEPGEEEKLSRLHRLAAEIEFDHFYFSNMKILWAGENPAIRTEEERKSILEELFAGLFEQHEDQILEIRSEAWKLAGQYGIDIESKLLQLDYTRWKKAVENWIREASEADVRIWEKRVKEWQTGEDIRYAYLLLRCREKYLLCYEGTFQESMEEAERLLWQYADSVLAMYRPLYREEVFEKMPEVLPEEAQLALKLKELQQYRMQGNIRQTLECLRNAIGIYPLLEPAMGAYAKLYRDEAEMQNNRAEGERQELLRIVEMLKSTAKMKLEQGEYEAAKEILQQVQQCMPEDEEAGELLKRAEEAENHFLKNSI